MQDNHKDMELAEEVDSSTSNNALTSTDETTQETTKDQTPSNAAKLSLALGVLSLLVGPLASIPGLFVAHAERKRISNCDSFSRSGKRMTLIGYWISVSNLAIVALSIVSLLMYYQRFMHANSRTDPDVTTAETRAHIARPPNATSTAPRQLFGTWTQAEDHHATRVTITITPTGISGYQYHSVGYSWDWFEDLGNDSWRFSGSQTINGVTVSGGSMTILSDGTLAIGLVTDKSGGRVSMLNGTFRR